ncbi:hypothetical protein N0V94_007485 [Neodidymelliopsis sp. IMI 364377]|nr:hypothetical protein N0V94_007485 [Neodidymelliopsis sp. IMI 364377]
MADADEWEYEYDEVETEDFYIPIDLSNIPKAQKQVDTERRTGHPTLLKSRLRALNAQRSQQQDASTVETSSNQESATLGEAQIVGLHTSNPLVMYNGQLLSCQWASTIGTDMFFAKPEVNASSEEKPLRSLPNVDLLAMSSAKLVARVGRLRPRDDLFDGSDEVAMQDTVATQAEGATEGTERPAEVSDPAPASFLARLNQAKAKRGESTRLVVSKSADGSRLVSATADATPDHAQDTAPEAGDVEMSGT